MESYESPARQPRNVTAIVVATAIACSGYLIFAARFGDPIREANAAAERAVEAESSLADAVRSEVELQVAEAVRQPDEFEDLRKRIDGVGRESHDKIARLEALVDDLGRRLTQAETALASRPPVGGETVTTREPTGAGEPQAEPPTTPVSTKETVLVQRSGDYKLEILGTSTNRYEITFDLTVTRERGGDGFVEVLAPRSGSRGTRIVTADGRELSKGAVGLYGKNKLVSSKDADVLEGVPMRFSLDFDYRGELPVRCARVQIVAFSKPGGKGRMVFSFDDVVVGE